MILSPGARAAGGPPRAAVTVTPAAAAGGTVTVTVTQAAHWQAHQAGPGTVTVTVNATAGAAGLRSGLARRADRDRRGCCPAA